MDQQTYGRRALNSGRCRSLLCPVWSNHQLRRTSRIEGFLLSKSTLQPRFKTHRDAAGTLHKVYLVPSDRQISVAPLPSCEHLALDPMQLPKCEECWELNYYLAGTFELDSWDYPDEWRRAWNRVVARRLPHATPEDRRTQQRAANKRWRIKNWEKVLARQLTRRAAIEAASDIERAQIERWFRWKRLPEVVCYWCKETFSPRQCHADHVMPLSRGGKHELSNLVIACSTCNLRKSATLPDVWTARMEAVALNA